MYDADEFFEHFSKSGGNDEDSTGIHDLAINHHKQIIIQQERQMATGKKQNHSLPSERLNQWMICREPQTGVYANEPNPKKLYARKELAVHDAEMLSRQQKTTFYLLKVVAFVTPLPPVVPELEWTNQDDDDY
jgi:hypothetical protein